MKNTISMYLNYVLRIDAELSDISNHQYNTLYL